jgi:hypothetical protein
VFQSDKIDRADFLVSMANHCEPVKKWCFSAAFCNLSRVRASDPLGFIAYATVVRIDRTLDERVSFQYFRISEAGERESCHGQVGR